MDTLHEGICLFAARGPGLVHTNVALRHLLAMERDPRLRKAVDRFAHALAEARSSSEIATGKVRTRAAAYILRGSYLAENPIGVGPAVMVAVERSCGRPSAGATLQDRFAFTRSEAQVAALIADGNSNIEIATSLCISRHTARHHTERIFAKLGVRSRAEAICKLLQG
jgi:DNA-binding CsgD family transcriptional regulator